MRDRRRPERPDARQAAFEILHRVETAGAYASILLESVEPRIPDPRDAALLHETVLGVLRSRSALDHAIDRVASRSVERMDPLVRSALRMGAYAVLLLDRVPDFAATDTTVDLVRRNGPFAAVGFANAVMRRLVAKGPSLLPPAPEPGDVSGLALHRSHPEWWVERLVETVGWERAGRILTSNNTPAATVVRPNLRRTTIRDLAIRLADEGVETESCRFAPEALRVRRGVVQRTRAFGEGILWIQDEASQLVPQLLGRVLRPRVADLCAAPGTKTLVLAEAIPTGGLVVAVDRSTVRLKRLSRNLGRIGAENVVVVAGDLLAACPLSGPFDHVLLDAPCGGTGTLRRHPEIRWRIRPEDLPILASRQARLLDAAALLVASGGTMVYSVCSLESEEGERGIERFLERNQNFRQLDASAVLASAAATLVGSDGALRTAPDRDGLDGFYATLLERVV